MIHSPAAILSDLDGVLVDSGAAVEAAWAQWARAHDLDPALLHGRIHGVRSLEVIREVAPDIDDLAAEAAAVEDLVLHGPAADVLPGAAALLGGATGLPFAVVTSCPGPLAARRFRDAQLPAPAVLVTADRVIHGKPDPEGYALAARELGVDPADCVVFEDAPAGIAAARGAGAQAIGITTTHTAEELRAAGAAEVATSVAGALVLLGLQPQL
jgi:sugar-phosphatase